MRVHVPPGLPRCRHLPNQYYVGARTPLGPNTLALGSVILVARTLEGCQVVPQRFVSCMQHASAGVSMCQHLVSCVNSCVSNNCVSMCQHPVSLVNTAWHAHSRCPRCYIVTNTILSQSFCVKVQYYIEIHAKPGDLHGGCVQGATLSRTVRR